MSIFLSFIGGSANAEYIRYSSGTGFFVTHFGHILTNNHVVANCERAKINGDNVSAGAIIVARDTEHDLALLQTMLNNSHKAYFNSMRNTLKKGDPVVLVGYPGNSWMKNREPVVRDSRIIEVKGPIGEKKWLQFEDAAQMGNSGGPLLDSAGNVVGVIVAKTMLQLRNNFTGEKITRKSDLAISLPVVKDFLLLNNVRYQTADSGIYLSPDRVAARTREFIVNITCKLQESK
ncbi:MAG: serine protease [Rickettsiales bacterium]